MAHPRKQNPRAYAAKQACKRYRKKARRLLAKGVEDIPPYRMRRDPEFH